MAGTLSNLPECAVSKGPTLVVLAAGLGSRFGGLKQLAPVGPHGETLLEYSIYDAARAGFGKAVIVIAAAFESAFREQVQPRLATIVDVEYVLQDDTGIGGHPPGLYGTAHAVLAAAPVVDGVFAVINADDFYGRAAYDAAHARLGDTQPHTRDTCFVIGYELGKTLSPAGPVSRAVIELDGARLTGLSEHPRIVKQGTHAASDVGGGQTETFSFDTPVSMNFWGFPPTLFDALLPLFHTFMGEEQRRPDAEFRLPDAVLALVRAGAASVIVERAGNEWFGMTYREDHDRTRQAIRQRIEAGEYPSGHSESARAG